ncbi:hypothetical protein BJV74DRAFT_880807 [Russula compacta]|nr:hypothetical protein BJV74DRAFT_880807 [Russula compacta]
MSRFRTVNNQVVLDVAIKEQSKSKDDEEALAQHTHAYTFTHKVRTFVDGTIKLGKDPSEQTGKATPRLSIRIPGLRLSGSRVISAPDQMTDDSDEEVDADDGLEDDHSLGGNKEDQAGVGGEVEIDEEARSEKRQRTVASVDSEIIEAIDSDVPPT